VWALWWFAMTQAWIAELIYNLTSFNRITQASEIIWAMKPLGLAEKLHIPI
jgi:hypothetical protein